MLTTAPLTLKTLLGRTPRTEALMSGQITSDLIALDFDDVMPVTNGFPAMVRDMPYDFGELALLTYLQSRVAGKPLVLLPFVLAAEHLHPHMHYNSDHGQLTADDLAGKRIGVRSYTQTTGLWIRGFLEEDYGIPLERQHWVCFQDPHVIEYREPEFVERAPPDRNLLDMLLNGEIDAAVGLGPVANEHPQLKRVFPDGAAQAWSSRTGIFPINHMPVVRRWVHELSPQVSQELFRLLSASKRAAPSVPGEVDIRPSGVGANRRGMELLIRWAVRQQLIPEPIAVDDLFDATTRELGA